MKIYANEQHLDREIEKVCDVTDGSLNAPGERSGADSRKPPTVFVKYFIEYLLWSTWTQKTLDRAYNGLSNYIQNNKVN